MLRPDQQDSQKGLQAAVRECHHRGYLRGCLGQSLHLSSLMRWIPAGTTGPSGYDRVERLPPFRAHRTQTACAPFWRACTSLARDQVLFPRSISMARSSPNEDRHQMSIIPLLRVLPLDETYPATLMGSSRCADQPLSCAQAKIASVKESVICRESSPTSLTLSHASARAEPRSSIVLASASLSDTVPTLRPDQQDSQKGHQAAVRVCHPRGCLRGCLEASAAPTR